jgi:hypothetical protein
MALGDAEHHGLIPALVGEIGGQLLPQQPGMGADNAILTRVVAGGAPEDGDADVLLGCLPGGIPEGAAGNIEQKFLQAGGGLEAPAGGDTLDEGPPGIV